MFLKLSTHSLPSTRRAGTCSSARIAAGQFANPPLTLAQLDAQQNIAGRAGSIPAARPGAATDQEQRQPPGAEPVVRAAA
jgi:hypothetical protein